jgi:hypothetical protein
VEGFFVSKFSAASASSISSGVAGPAFPLDLLLDLLFFLGFVASLDLVSCCVIKESPVFSLIVLGLELP